LGLFALGALLLIIRRVADATANISDSLSGRTLARLDIGFPLLVTCGAYLLAHHIVNDPYNQRRPWRSARTARLVMIMAAFWWVTMAVTIAAVHPGGTSKQLLATVALFRNPRNRLPLSGTSIGTVALILAPRCGMRNCASTDGAVGCSQNESIDCTLHEIGLELRCWSWVDGSFDLLGHRPNLVTGPAQSSPSQS
jgi:multisubunit Na+/H+ antiporter MnhB subunit